MLFIMEKKRSLLYITLNTCTMFHYQHFFQAVTRQITHEQMTRRMKLVFGESRGGRPGLPVPNSPYGLCGGKATLEEVLIIRAKGLCESRGGRPGLPVLL